MELKYYKSHEELEETVHWLERMHKIALAVLLPVAVIGVATLAQKRIKR